MSNFKSGASIFAQWGSVFRGAILSLGAMVVGAGAAANPADPSGEVTKYFVYASNDLNLIGAASSPTQGFWGAGHDFGQSQFDSVDFKTEIRVANNFFAGASGATIGEKIYRDTVRVKGTITPSPRPIGLSKVQNPGVFATSTMPSLAASSIVANGVTKNYGWTSGVRDTLLPGIYGDLIFNDQTTEIVLKSGDYYFNNIDFGGVLKINNSDGKVTRIIVKNNFKMSNTGNAPALIVANSANLGKVLLYVAGTSVTIPSGGSVANPTQVDATIVAPFADVVVNSEVKVRGQIFAKNINISNNFNGAQSTFIPFDPTNVTLVFADGSNVKEGENRVGNTSTVTTKANGQVATYDMKVKLTDANGLTVASGGTVVMPFTISASSSANPAKVSSGTGRDIFALSSTSGTCPADSAAFVAAAAFNTGNVTYNVNDTLALIRLCVFNDGSIEGNEPFNLVFSNPTTGAEYIALSQTSYALNVTDDIENQAPNPTTLSNNTVDERSTFVGVFAKSDPDAGNTVSLTINDVVNFRISGDSLYLKSAAIYENTDGSAGTRSYPLTVTATDNLGASTPTSFTITVNNKNDELPLAVEDVLSVSEGGTASINVLSNDRDTVDHLAFAGQTLTLVDKNGNASALGGAQWANTVSLANGGTLSYTHNGTEHFTDTLYYVLNDNGIVTANTKDTGRVIVSITPVNDQNPVLAHQSGSLAENATLSGTVTATDADLPNDTLSYTANANTVNGGTFSINSATGAYTYTNKGHGTELASDSVQITVTDRNSHSTNAWLVFTVNLINDESPVARDTLYTTLEDQTLNISAPGLLALQSDLDGPAATIRLGRQAQNGTATVNANGSFQYVPNQDWNGTDSLTYIVSDGLFEDTAVVKIRVNAVNDAPLGRDTSFSTNEDTRLTVNLPGILGSASDVDGDVLKVTKLADVSHGTLILDSMGSFTYDPTLNYNGADTLTAVITDGHGGTKTITVFFTVNAVNDAPVGINQTFTTKEDTVLNVNAANGVLKSATDVENDVLKTTVLAGVSHGNLVLDSLTGAFSYTPASNYFGADAFTALIKDGNGGLDTVSIQLTVNEINDTATAISPLNVTLAENSAKAVLVTRLNTTDVADALVPETFSYSLVDPTGNDGAYFEIKGDSLLVFNSAILNYENKNLFKIVVKSTDRGGAGIAIQDTLRIQLTDVNESPVRNTAMNAMTLQEEFADTLAATLSSVFADPDQGENLKFALSTSNSKLSAVLRGDSLILSSKKDSVGAVQVYVTATDKGGLVAYDTLNVQIQNVNDAPLFKDSSYHIAENSTIGSLVGLLKAYDVDVNLGLDNIYFKLIVPNSRFTTSNDSILSVGTLDYEAKTADTLTVEVSDQGGLRDTATIIVNLDNVVEKSRLNLLTATSVLPEVNNWTAVRDTVLGHIRISNSKLNVSGLDTLWTKDSTFKLSYTEDGREVDSSLSLNATLQQNGYGIQEVLRTYHNPTKDLGDTVRFVVAYNTKKPTLRIDTTVHKYILDTLGRIWVNDSIMKKDKGNFDWDISTVGSDPYARVKVDSTVRAQLAEGENTLVVAYTDRYGNTSYDTVRIVVDTKFPVVHISNPRGPAGQDSSKVFSLRVPVEWEIDGTKQNVQITEGLVEGANAIVRGSCDFARNCAYDTVWVDALFDDNRIQVKVENGIVGLDKNGNRVTEEQQLQKEEDYYKLKNEGRGESQVIPTEEGYNLTVVNAKTGLAEEILYYDGTKQKKIDTSRRVGVDTNLSIGPRVKIKMLFPIVDDSTGTCPNGKPMWEFNVQAIDANIYDQIGQFVTNVHVPGFTVDKLDYQQDDGTVDAYLEMPKVRNDMRSINGQRWGDGVYLINIRVRTSALGVNCNVGNKNPAAISTMVKIGYIRAK